jgi:two-component system, cell cycle sensor histidine kinase and response regulator CckA
MTQPSPLPEALSPRDRTESDIDQTLIGLSKLFEQLGPDPEQNILTIVNQTHLLFASACALYHKIDGRHGGRVYWAGKNMPIGFPPASISNGRLLRDSAINGNNHPLVLENLGLTPYIESDPFLGQYRLNSYLGHPVSCKGKIIGVLCIADHRVRKFSSAEIRMIGMLAKSLSLEEERKQSGKAPRESERRYREQYDTAPAMLCSLDLENRITSASDLWLATMGYAREEVIGRPLFDYFAPESRRDAVDIYFPEFYKLGHMKNKLFQFITKEGQAKDVLLSAVARKTKDGSYDGAQAFVADVSQSDASEKEQRRLSARLQQAQKMEAIATLAGGIAHQFNNALAVILGNLELIELDGLVNQKLSRFVNPISQASQKMVQLTSQLLAYARGGKFQTQIVPAHRFVREALSLVSHSFSSNLEIKTDLDEKADHIEVDATQMQMLLAAILSNASESMANEGTVTISVNNVEVTAQECLNQQGLFPGRSVLLRITDSGKGMDEEIRARIFEPFFTTKFQGRGLGMAAVYGIVKKHGGYVAVASKPDRGTTVSIYLPSVQPVAHETAAEKPFKPQGSGTALIVEDELLVMEVNRAIVERLGYRVLEAKSGVEALDIARTHSGTIDFALLDVILPDMSGNQIYPKLMEILPGLKVIVCSGYTLDGPAREILNAGAQSFLPKPFTVATLSNTLDRILAPKD